MFHRMCFLENACAGSTVNDPRRVVSHDGDACSGLASLLSVGVAPAGGLFKETIASHIPPIAIVFWPRQPFAHHQCTRPRGQPRWQTGNASLVLV